MSFNTVADHHHLDTARPKKVWAGAWLILALLLTLAASYGLHEVFGPLEIESEAPTVIENWHGNVRVTTPLR
ncbi:MAG: hypothetical protein AAF318_16340 [Pseudomonadota bacterium]